MPLLLLAVAIAAPPRAASCTITVSEGTPRSKLSLAAVISRSKAERAAREFAKRLGAYAAQLVYSDLVLEHGCLIWAFDLRLAGETAISKAHVDAGDGRVLFFERGKSEPRWDE